MSSSRWGASAGFTLIEVALAIVIGIILLAGVTVLYGQAKQSAGNARANEKLIALQALVEESVAQTNNYPNPPTLRELWAQRRPDDYLANPWGGGLAITPFPNGLRTFVNESPFNAVGPGSVDQVDAGYIEYHQIAGTATSSPWDVTVGGNVVVRGYYVNFIGPDATYWWFVRGGR